MKFSAIASCLAATAMAAPFSFPLPDGFPSLSKAAFLDVQNRAGGPYFNSVPVMKLNNFTVVRLQALAAAEIIEAAYFAQLYNNLTSNTPGFELKGQDKDFIIGSIKRIAAVEELHAMSVNDVLTKVGASAVPPCGQYSFPVSNFQSAILLANMFTDLGLATLPVLIAAAGGDNGNNDGPALVPYLTAVNSQEAQQAAWFRQLQGQYPTASPFLSTSVFKYALSAFGQFLVKSTCPAAYDATTKAVGAFDPLNIMSSPTPKNQQTTFSVTGKVDPATMSIAYLSGQNRPVTVAISNVQAGANNQTTFQAPFPATNTIDGGFVSGLTIAALVNSKKQFVDATDVADSTINGPGMIEYNY